MTTKQLPEFVLCQECLHKYRELRFDADAPFRENIIPFATILWQDEHPSGDPRPGCQGKRCARSISLLISARSEYWAHGEVSPENTKVWSMARELIPNWPGFQRLNPSIEQRAWIEKCFREADEWFGALAQTPGARLELPETESGSMEWTTTIDLKPHNGDAE